MNRRSFLRSIVAAVALAPVLAGFELKCKARQPFATCALPSHVEGVPKIIDFFPARFSYDLEKGEYVRVPLVWTDRGICKEYETAAFEVGVYMNEEKSFVVMGRRCLPAIEFPACA